MLVLYSHTVFGYDNMRLFKNPKFQNYTISNGLLSSLITDIEQDDMGYIWMASAHGLMRYSGNSFLNFQQQTESKTLQLPSNYISDIQAAKNGDMIVNTTAGTVVYDYKNNKLIKLNQKHIGWGKLTVNSVNDVYHSTWYGIQKYQWENKNLKLNKDFAETSKASILQLKSINNVIWACSEEGYKLIEIKHDKVFKHQLKMDQVYHKITAIYGWDNNSILVGTATMGLLKFNSNTKLFTPILPYNVFNNSIKCITNYCIGKDTFMIVGTENKGVFVYCPTTRQMQSLQTDVRIKNSLVSNHINHLFVDANLGLWIATDKGVSYFHPSLQKTSNYYLNIQGYDDVLINYSEQLNEDLYLIASSNKGLLLYNNKDKTVVKILSEEDIKEVHHILRISDRDLLIATSVGLFKYNVNKNSVSPYHLKNEKINIEVLNLSKLNNTKVGLCTVNGAWIIDLFNNTTFFKEKYIESPIQNKRYCIDMLLLNNELFVLRMYNGIDKYSLLNRQEIEITPKILVNKPIDYHHFRENKGYIYIASTSGILKIKANSEKDYQIMTTKDGLEGDHINHILFDEKKGVFLYNNIIGVFIYNEKSKQSKPLFYYENYNQKWGHQFNLDKDGNIVMSISNYFLLYNTVLGFNNENTPRNDLSSVYLNNQILDLTKQKFEFNFKENNLKFILDSRVYPESGKNKWLYRIKGLIPDWRVNSSGIIELNNLAPDEYVLEVYSLNNEGVKSTISSYGFKIKKPFYNMWWFYFLVFILFIILIRLFFWYKSKQTEKLNSVRNQISRDLHDELGANVSSLNIMSQLLKNKLKNDKDSANLTDKISKYSIEVSNNMNDIIWNINPKFDTISELVKKIISYGDNLMENSNILFELSLQEPIYEFKIKSEVKYHLYLIFKEALNNIAKHSKTNKVKLMIESNKKGLNIVIKDYGIGFNPEKDTSRNGVLNMKERAKTIGAELNINSIKNNGTEIKLFYKIS